MAEQQTDPLRRFKGALQHLQGTEASSPLRARAALAALADLAADLSSNHAENAHEVLGEAAGQLARLNASPIDAGEPLVAEQIGAWREQVLSRFESDPVRFRIVAIKTAEQLIKRFDA